MVKIDLEKKCKGFTSFEDCNKKCPKKKCGEYQIQKDYLESLQIIAQESSENRINLIYNKNEQ
jgi:hypothetical protein